YPKRKNTSSSVLVNKKSILETESVRLNYEPAKTLDVGDILGLNDQIGLLSREKSRFDALLAKFSESLNKPAITRFERKVSIGDLFVVKAGKELPKFKISEDGRFPVYGGNGIIGRYEEFNLSGENILIGRVGANCGNVHYVKGPIWVTNNSFSVQLKSKQQVCIEYLVYALRNLNLN